MGLQSPSNGYFEFGVGRIQKTCVSAYLISELTYEKESFYENILYFLPRSDALLGFAFKEGVQRKIST